MGLSVAILTAELPGSLEEERACARRDYCGRRAERIRTAPRTPPLIEQRQVVV